MVDTGNNCYLQMFLAKVSSVNNTTTHGTTQTGQNARTEDLSYQVGVAPGTNKTYLYNNFNLFTCFQSSKRGHKRNSLESFKFWFQNIVTVQAAEDMEGHDLHTRFCKNRQEKYVPT